MQRRDHIETAQAELLVLLRDVDEVILRTRQAMRRTPLVNDVLQPGLERLTEMQASLRRVKDNIDNAWADGEKVRWKNEDTHSPRRS